MAKLKLLNYKYKGISTDIHNIWNGKWRKRHISNIIVDPFSSKVYIRQCVEFLLNVAWDKYPLLLYLTRAILSIQG